MDLSIIIVNWNTRDLLKTCLTAVYAHVRGIDFEVIVVDNASEDDSVAMVQAEFPQVRLVQNTENTGFTRANNQAIPMNDAEFVLLLNSDAFLRAGTVDTLIHALRNDPGAGAAGGLLLNPDGSFQASYYDFPTVPSELATLAGINTRLYWPEHPSHPASTAQTPVKDAGWVMGACLLVRRTTIDAVGLMDEGYYMYAEEMDWLYRMNQAGWRVLYVPDAVTTHVGGASNQSASPRKRINLARSKQRFFRKHYGPGRAGLLSAGVKGIALLRLVIFGLLWLIPSKREGATVRLKAAWAMLLG